MHGSMIVTKEQVKSITQYYKFSPLTPNEPLYGSYRTANLQTLHFIYLFNKYT